MGESLLHEISVERDRDRAKGGDGVHQDGVVVGGQPHVPARASVRACVHAPDRA